jgi:two-component system sensor histidine kinase RegB
MTSGSTDRIELSWLVTVRWTTLAACVGAIVFGRTALGVEGSPLYPGAALLAVALSNIWLHQAARGSKALPSRVPGLLVCADVVLLAGCLAKSGGVLNPASIFFLVEIVLAALALGLPWTWVVTALSVAGYGAQLLAPTSELSAAATMHPQIGEHMRGMWWAFVITAIIIGALVTRLALTIERRDRALMRLREDAARQMRLMSLASMAAGAAHELSTPLSTIAVAAGELAHAAAMLPGGDTLAEDIALIRAELTRSRRILTDLSGRADEGSAAIDAVPVGAAIDRAIDARPAGDRARVNVVGQRTIIVTWPIALVARALDNVIANGLQASADGVVMVSVAPSGDDRVSLTVSDQGSGMTAETLSRAGEPFFTTRADSHGMGLGLFVARATAQQLGGTLIIDSTLGRGTTVEFDLPRAPIAGPR